MGFIRENILKILTIVVVFIIAIVVIVVFFGGKNVKSSSSYSNMESNLVLTTKKYLNDNKKLIPKNNGEISKVNIDTLVNEKYMKDLFAIEDSNIKCSGYVQIINKEGNYDYVPYVKCGKYYETKKISDYILDNYVEIVNEDGLYKMGEKYVFKGEDPNNYIKLGNRIYRIIEINEKGELKLISTERYIDQVVWDDRYNVERDKDDGINDFSKSRLKDSLKEVFEDVEFFTEEEKNKIVEHDICIGKRTKTDVSIDGASECQQQYPNQKISIIQLSEYSRASIDPNCKTINDKACINYNYMKNISSSMRTITASADNTYQVYLVNNGVADLVRASASFSLYPVIYIDNLSIYNSGDGSLENPYTIR